LYTQFGEDIMPNEVLLALKKAFKYVYDQAYTHELFNLATELYIKENREKASPIWPLISPICPVVNRLIAHRFPSLLKHVLPIVTPRELAAREAKKRLRHEKVFKTEDFGVYHVTPCSAKMISISSPMFLETSYLDGAVGIHEVYDLVTKNLQHLEEEVMLHRSGGVGLGWGISGGEIAGLDEGNCLAVSGIQETIRYLEKIEMGLFREIEYFEFRTCLEGCIGGPLTVSDRYQAKHTLQRLVRLFGQEKRPKYASAQKAYEEGWFFAERKEPLLGEQEKRLGIREAIERQQRVEDLLQKLPGKECGACGSPDCQTFAEDVAEERVALAACIFLRQGKKEGDRP